MSCRCRQPAGGLKRLALFQFKKFANRMPKHRKLVTAHDFLVLSWYALDKHGQVIATSACEARLRACRTGVSMGGLVAPYLDAAIGTHQRVSAVVAGQLCGSCGGDALDAPRFDSRGPNARVVQVNIYTKLVEFRLFNKCVRAVERSCS